MSSTQAIAPPLQALLAGLSQEGERHLGEVQADLRQTTYLLGAAIEKLGKSFTGIHEAMVAQQQLLSTHDAAGPSAAAALQDRLAQLQEDGRVHANAAVTALQFEDMTGQLIGRIAGHVESLQSILGAVGAGAAALTDAVAEAAPETVSAERMAGAAATPAHGDVNPDAAVAAVLASLNRALAAHGAGAPSVAKRAVAQTHMDSGDIELF